MRNLGNNNILINYALSKNIIELNTIIPSSNTPFFYYIDNLESFLKTYSHPIDLTLISGDGNTLLSIGSLQNKKVVESKLNNYPQIDINLQYYIKSNKKKNLKPGDTLLHQLCRYKNLNINIFQLLLNKGAKLIKNDDGETPIDILKKQEYSKSPRPVITLLEKHFDIYVSDPSNITKYLDKK